MRKKKNINELVKNSNDPAINIIKQYDENNVISLILYDRQKKLL